MSFKNEMVNLPFLLEAIHPPIIVQPKPHSWYIFFLWFFLRLKKHYDLNIIFKNINYF